MSSSASSLPFSSSLLVAASSSSDKERVRYPPICRYETITRKVRFSLLENCLVCVSFGAVSSVMPLKTNLKLSKIYDAHVLKLRKIFLSFTTFFVSFVIFSRSQTHMNTHNPYVVGTLSSCHFIVVDDEMHQNATAKSTSWNIEKVKIFNWHSQ